MEMKKTNGIREVLNERGNRYGEYPDHAIITQNIKRAMALGKNWDQLPDPMKEALEMTAHKIGRILNGDPWYDDSWVDIIGYIQLGVDFIHSIHSQDDTNESFGDIL